MHSASTANVQYRYNAKAVHVQWSGNSPSGAEKPAQVLAARLTKLVKVQRPPFIRTRNMGGRRSPVCSSRETRSSGRPWLTSSSSASLPLLPPLLRDQTFSFATSGVCSARRARCDRSNRVAAWYGDCGSDSHARTRCTNVPIDTDRETPMTPPLPRLRSSLRNCRPIFHEVRDRRSSNHYYIISIILLW